MSIIHHPERSIIAPAGIKRVAVMQPYFFPYAGYFRLMAASDVFVSYDCVQFPKGGWVNRNRLPDAAGEPAWLTLPLKHIHLGETIADVEFSADAPALIRERMQRFPSLTGDVTRACSLVEPDLMTGSIGDYLFERLVFLRDLLGFETRLIRSRDLNFDRSGQGEARLLALLDTLGATHYVNAPGGVDLYDPSNFAARGIELGFLAPFQGETASILYRLMTEPADRIRQEIVGQSR